MCMCLVALLTAADIWDSVEASSTWNESEKPFPAKIIVHPIFSSAQVLLKHPLEACCRMLWVVCALVYAALLLFMGALINLMYAWVGHRTWYAWKPQ